MTGKPDPNSRASMAREIERLNGRVLEVLDQSSKRQEALTHAENTIAQIRRQIQEAAANHRQKVEQLEAAVRVRDATIEGLRLGAAEARGYIQRVYEAEVAAGQHIPMRSSPDYVSSNVPEPRILSKLGVRWGAEGGEAGVADGLKVRRVG